MPSLAFSLGGPDWQWRVIGRGGVRQKNLAADTGAERTCPSPQFLSFNMQRKTWHAEVKREYKTAF